MISARAGTGWQTTLADLSIILFMVTASVLSQSDVPPAQARVPQPSPQSQPMAIYRAESGAPALGPWLASQSADARQQLTIIAQFTPGQQVQALAQAEALAREAGEAGTRARIVVEPGVHGVTASLAYDDPKATVAQPLQRTAGNE